MELRLPHFANTLLFRISAAFLLLMAISLGGYYLWIESTVFSPYENEAEENWYNNLAAAELDTLATRMAGAGSDSAQGRLLEAYGRTVQRFGIDVVAFDAAGNYVWSSAPDSLAVVIPTIDARILSGMSKDDWDFGSYPDSVNADAYVNRIFDVNEIPADERTQSARYLAANYGPISVVSTDLNLDSQLIDAQDTIFKVLMGLLIYSAVTALLILVWTGRRIQRLSAGVDSFAAGDLTHRVPTRSTDEIGTLGRNFNSMAERIETMVEKLRQKEQFQRQLIANVSHDLRTPMASMRGYVETLQMEGRQIEAGQRDRYLRIIAGNLDHLDRLVEHMLILSRFDSGQATWQMENFPIAELAENVLSRFEGLAAGQNIRLALTVDADVELVHADPLQVAQVLQNLIENGIKFNRPAGTVSVDIKRQDQRVALAVRDTGRGIPAADLPRIFDRFFTGNPSRTRQAGAADVDLTGHYLEQSSGLGLSIAAKIVAGHNSTLQVDSTLDEGSVFRFQLDHAQADVQGLSAGT